MEDIQTKKVSRAYLIKTLDKHFVQKNWPFARVKNTIKYYALGSTRISHYEGLELLANKKKIHINELIKLTLRQYSGSELDSQTILKGNKWRPYY
jgi:hypothetical protein